MALFKGNIAWFADDVEASVKDSWGKNGGKIAKSHTGKESITFFFSSNGDDDDVKKIMAKSPPILVFLPTYVTDCVHGGTLLNPGTYILPPKTFLTTGVEMAPPVSAHWKKEQDEEEMEREEAKNAKKRSAAMREGYEPLDDGEKGCNAAAIVTVVDGEGGWRISAQKTTRRTRVVESDDEEEQNDEEEQSDEAEVPVMEEDVPGVAPAETTEKLHELNGDFAMATTFVQGQVSMQEIADQWWTDEQDAALIAVIKTAMNQHGNRLSKTQVQNTVTRLEKVTKKSKIQCRIRWKYLEL